MLKNIGNSYGNLNKYMEQLSSGKKITRPSEDPVVALKGMNYRSQLSKNTQYERNLAEVHNWLDNTDQVLDETTLVMKRINDLALQAANGTNNKEDLVNISQEADQLINELVNLANTRINDKYLFNGTDTSGGIGENGERVQPFIRNEDGTFTVSVNTSEVMIEVSSGIRFKSNTDPTQVFSEAFFNDLQAFVNDLKNSEESGVSISDHLESIEGHIDQTLNERASLGARMNRIDLVENRLASQSISIEAMMSDNEDVDTAEVIMKLMMQESIHRASLSAGARVLQPTLLDFLR